MNMTLLSGLVIVGVFVSSGAWGTNHPKPCASIRDDLCKPFWPAASCDKLYQEAIARGGVWIAKNYDRRMNQQIEQVTICVP